MTKGILETTQDYIRPSKLIDLDIVELPLSRYSIGPGVNKRSNAFDSSSIHLWQLNELSRKEIYLSNWC